MISLVILASFINFTVPVTNGRMLTSKVSLGNGDLTIVQWRDDDRSKGYYNVDVWLFTDVAHNGVTEFVQPVARLRMTTSFPVEVALQPLAAAYVSGGVALVASTSAGVCCYWFPPGKSPDVTAEEASYYRLIPCPDGIANRLPVLETSVDAAPFVVGEATIGTVRVVMESRYPNSPSERYTFPFRYTGKGKPPVFTGCGPDITK